MGDIVIYHNGRCSKSRGTLDILQEKNIPQLVRYYLLEPLNEKELKEILHKLHIKAHELVRQNETLYKEVYKGKDLAEKEWVKILVEHPILIERPIVVNGNKAVIARPPEKVLEIL